ncbi:Uncharacterised protein [Bergeyella zoohelcum]|uniref:DUF8188 domain-containing protein n=3 Tax=Bergeyella zoohelcum TaxID=1015 RepID=A0A376C0M9_9FLAO|nr:Uncharacterised protein [Bergeyella zoohelcum]
MLLRILGAIGVILLLNFLINLIFVSKNNGKEFIETYIKESKVVKVKVDLSFFQGMNSHESYFKGTFLFRGIYGNTSDLTFKDDYSKLYFKLMRFDPYGDKFSLPQSSKIENQELIVKKVDPLQLNDKKFGTKQNPILVFWYKGANKELMTEMETGEREENGRSIYEHVLLSPTEKEYRYNVEQYLTYVMPKEEFKRRFKNK